MRTQIAIAFVVLAILCFSNVHEVSADAIPLSIFRHIHAGVTTTQGETSSSDVNTYDSGVFDKTLNADQPPTIFASTYQFSSEISKPTFSFLNGVSETRVSGSSGSALAYSFYFLDFELISAHELTLSGKLYSGSTLSPFNHKRVTLQEPTKVHLDVEAIGSRDFLFNSIFPAGVYSLLLRIDYDDKNIDHLRQNTAINGWEFGLQVREVPVPEPSTMFLLGSGLIGLAGYGRRKFFKK